MMKILSELTRKGIYMVMAVCALSMVAACGDDDDDENNSNGGTSVNGGGGGSTAGGSALVGTWELVEKIEYYMGHAVTSADGYKYLIFTDTQMFYTNDREDREHGESCTYTATADGKLTPHYENDPEDETLYYSIADGQLIIKTEYDAEYDEYEETHYRKI